MEGNDMLFSNAMWALLIAKIEALVGKAANAGVFLMR